MEPLGSQLTIYTNTAGAIAPQSRLIAPEDSPFNRTNTRSDRNADALRADGSGFENLRGSLGSASDLLSQASTDLSRIGDALDEIDALVETAEDNSDLSRQQRAQLGAQIEDYLSQIDDIAANSNFDGKNLLAEDRTITLQVGSGTSSDNQLDVELYASSSEDLATGLSSIDLSDGDGVADARTLVDEAQQALRDREISLNADRDSLAIAQDQNRVLQVASDSVLQAQIAASQSDPSEDNRARIFENLQAYLGNISTQLENQTVTVGGFSLPEPEADPFAEPPRDPYAYDPLAPSNNDQDPEYAFAAPTGATDGSIENSTRAFTGYDSGGNGTSGSSGSTGGGSGSRVSVEV